MALRGWAVFRFWDGVLGTAFHVTFPLFPKIYAAKACS